MLGYTRNLLKYNSEFMKKSHLAATLPQGCHRHRDDSIAGCMVCAWCGDQNSNWMDTFMQATYNSLGLATWLLAASSYIDIQVEIW